MASKGASYSVLGPEVFQVVNKQVEAGLYVCRRTALFLKKISSAQEDYAKSVSKITKHETSKMKAMQEDSMLHYVMASVEVQEVSERMASRAATLAQKVRQEVVDPLEKFYKMADKQRESIAKKFNKHSSRISSLRNTVEKERQYCIRLFEDCKVEFHRLDEEQTKGGDRQEKYRKNLLKAREKAQKQFLKFEKLRDSAQRELDVFYSKDIPDVLAEMTALENERMMTLKRYMSVYSQHQQEATAPLKNTKGFADMVGGLNCEAELKTHVDRLLQQHGKAKREPMNVVMPCTSDIILTDQWMKGGDSKAGRDPSSSLSANKMPQRSPPPGDPPTPSEAKSSGIGKSNLVDSGKPAVLWVTAVFDYPNGQPGDLTFMKGNVIKVTQNGGATTIDPNNPEWWEGEVFGTLTSGKFPSNYMEVITDQAKITQLNSDLAAMQANSGGASSALSPSASSSIPEETPTAAAAPAATGLTCTAMFPFTYEPSGDPNFDDLQYLQFEAGVVIEVTNQDDPQWWYGTLNGTEGYFPSNLVEANT